MSTYKITLTTEASAEVAVEARTRTAMIRAWNDLTEIEQARFYDEP